MVQTLAADLGEQFCPEWRFVNVFLNGQYKGLYTLFQKIAVERGTVQIRNLEEENSQLKEGVDPEDITGGYLLELAGEWNWDKAPVRIETKHRWIKVKSPKNASDQELMYISDLTEKAEEHLYTDDKKDADWTDFWDIDSWAIQYLLQEISSNCDAEMNSEFFYVNQGERKLYGGPAWDFDRSLWIPTDNEGETYVVRHLHVAGLHDDDKPEANGEADQSNLWLQEMDTHPEFHQHLKTLYLETGYAALREIVEQEIPAWRSEIQASLLADTIRWNGEYGTYEEAWTAQDRVVSILSGRADFLRDYYTKEDAYVLVRFSVDYARYDLIVPVIRGQSVNEDVMPLVNGSQEWHTEDGVPFTRNTIVESDITVYPSGEPGQ